MARLTSSQVCDQEYRSAMRAFRPSLDRESAGRTVAAPTVVNQGRGTPWVNASNLDVTRSRIVRRGCVVEFPGGAGGGKNGHTTRAGCMHVWVVAARHEKHSPCWNSDKRFRESG